MEKDVKKQYEKYESVYSEDGLLSKLSQFAKNIGLNSCYYILLLYYILKIGEATLKEKAIIIGSLGYVISPFDVIPDFLIGTGYVDDAAALLFALTTLSGLITKLIKDAAKTKLKEFFDFKDDELNSSYR